jgi:hypothetical protein
LEVKKNRLKKCGILDFGVFKATVSVEVGAKRARTNEALIVVALSAMN